MCNQFLFLSRKWLHQIDNCSLARTTPHSDIFRHARSFTKISEEGEEDVSVSFFYCTCWVEKELAMQQTSMQNSASQICLISAVLCNTLSAWLPVTLYVSAYSTSCSSGAIWGPVSGTDFHASPPHSIHPIVAVAMTQSEKANTLPTATISSMYAIIVPSLTRLYLWLKSISKTRPFPSWSWAILFTTQISRASSKCWSLLTTDIIAVKE